MEKKDMKISLSSEHWEKIEERASKNRRSVEDEIGVLLEAVLNQKKRKAPEKKVFLKNTEPPLNPMCRIKGFPFFTHITHVLK